MANDFPPEVTVLFPGFCFDCDAGDDAVVGRGLRPVRGFSQPQWVPLCPICTFLYELAALRRQYPYGQGLERIMGVSLGQLLERSLDRVEEMHLSAVAGRGPPPITRPSITTPSAERGAPNPEPPVLPSPADEEPAETSQDSGGS